MKKSHQSWILKRHREIVITSFMYHVCLATQKHLLYWSLPPNKDNLPSHQPSHFIMSPHPPILHLGKGRLHIYNVRRINTTTTVIMFWELFIFYQASLSPQVKRSLIISNKTVYTSVVSKVAEQLKTFIQHIYSLQA